MPVEGFVESLQQGIYGNSIRTHNNTESWYNGTGYAFENPQFMRNKATLITVRQIYFLNFLYCKDSAKPCSSWTNICHTIINGHLITSIHHLTCILLACQLKAVGTL